MLKAKMQKSNLFENGYDVIKSLIKDYVADPTNVYKRKWIYASMPDLTASKFAGFPFIVVTSPDISQDDRDFDTNRANTYRFLITIWSDKESDVDELSSDIYNILLEHENDLNDESLYNMELSSGPFESEIFNEKTIFSRPLGIVMRGWV